MGGREDEKNLGAAWAWWESLPGPCQLVGPGQARQGKARRHGVWRGQVPVWCRLVSTVLRTPYSVVTRQLIPVHGPGARPAAPANIRREWRRRYFILLGRHLWVGIIDSPPHSANYPPTPPTPPTQTITLSHFRPKLTWYMTNNMLPACRIWALTADDSTWVRQFPATHSGF